MNRGWVSALTALLLGCAATSPADVEAPAPAAPVPSAVAPEPSNEPELPQRAWTNIRLPKLKGVQCHLSLGEGARALQAIDAISAKQRAGEVTLTRPEQMWLAIYRGMALDFVRRGSDARKVYAEAQQIHPHPMAVLGSEKPIWGFRHIARMRYDCGNFDEGPIEVTAAGAVIKGTISIPRTEPPFTGVLLIAGSGPTDRNWESPLLPGANGSGRLLAQELARRGLLVVRYDKRASGRSTRPKAVAWPDYVAEQKALIDLMVENKVDRSTVFVAGHSEGGLHALRLITREKVDVAGLILLATPGRPLIDVTASQVEQQLLGAGVPKTDATAQTNKLRSALDSVARGKSVDASSVSPIPGVQALVRAFQQPAAQSFIRELLAFDSQKTIAQLRAPVLVLNGEKDAQVSAELDAKPLAEAAKRAGSQVTLELVAHANHVLKKEEEDPTGPQAGLRYNAPDRWLHPKIAPAIADFIEGQTNKK